MPAKIAQNWAASVQITAFIPPRNVYAVVSAPSPITATPPPRIEVNPGADALTH